MVFHHQTSSLSLEAWKLQKVGGFILCDCGQVKSLFTLTKSLQGVKNGDDLKLSESFKSTLKKELDARCAHLKMKGRDVYQKKNEDVTFETETLDSSWF